MLPKSNLLKDVQIQFKLDLIENFENQEIEIFADYVFEEFCNLNRIDRIVKTNYRLCESEIVKINQAVKKLNSNMPIQYVVNKAYFYGLSFYVNPSVLIPRPETEELVSWILENTNNDYKKNVLDVGTGSGCIAISLAERRRNFDFKGVDISEEALMIAGKNAKFHNVNVAFSICNALEIETMPNEKFDIIVSNPPYVLNFEKNQMCRNVLDFEPELALFVSNENSLIFYKKITEYAQHNLKKNGILFFEINEKLSNEVTGIMEQYSFFNIEIKEDFRGKKRMVKGIKY